MILLGGLLVLATWLAVMIALISAGLPFVRPNGSRWRFTPAHLATATWWGLAVLTLAGYLLTFLVPLGSATSAIAVTVVVVILGLIGWGSTLRAGFARPRWSKATIALAAALALTAGYLALAVLGPVTHYDAGLYQWGAVQYATDFSVLPGLANLYGPLGYAGAEPVLGGLLQATPWQGEGFRLLNGVFLVLLGTEALTRTMCRPRSAGTAIALAGSALVFPPMIWMADFWVASPTPDLPVLVLAIVSAAYVADLATDNSRSSSWPTILVLAGLMTALRPTAAGLAGALVIAALAISIARKKALWSLPAAAALLLAAALAVAVGARDRMLSGWLQYPLSIYAFDVPWRAPDPSGLREATLGFARDPENWQQATTGWGWVGSWIARLPQQWEPWWLLAALITAAALLAVRARRNARLRALLAVGAPFVVAAALWWAISPPALRFGWGPLFGITAVFLGWALWRSRWQTPAAVSAAAGIALVALVAGVIRLDWTTPRVTEYWLGIPYQVVSLPAPGTDEFVTDSGLALRVPTETDQCWSVYPLCTPDPTRDLELLHSEMSSGFESQ